jgi:ABC-type transport system involved in multi-copper enzyme maturation permease subunit
MSESRLGAPVELPWWVVPLGLPPLAIAVAGIVVSAPLWAHLLAVIASITLLGALALVATRIASRSMQSVWVSAAYAVWVFATVVWAVAVATTPACNCA